MYVSPNFKSKKAFKEAVVAAIADGVPLSAGLRLFQPGHGPRAPFDGTVSVEGPHYPAPHSWYATVTIKDGLIVKVS